MANNDIKYRLAMEGASVVSSDLDRVRASLTSLEGASTLAGNAFATLAGYMTADAVLQHTKSIIDSADAVNDLSQSLGIAVKDLAKYQLASAQSGTTLEAIAKGVKGLSGVMMDHGTELKKLGITATTTDGAFQQFADIFSKMPDGMEKSNLAVKVFGKSGMDLIPMLNMGSAGLAEAAEKSAKYAVALAILAPQADKFNDSMAELGMYAKISGMTLMNEMLPGLLAVATAAAKAGQEGGTFKAAYTGWNELWWESWGRSLTIMALKANAWFAELEAKKQRFLWGDNKAAGEYQNQANEAYLNIQALIASQPKLAAANKPASTGFDLDAYTAEIKAKVAALRKMLGDGNKQTESEYDKLTKKLGTDLAKATADAQAAQMGYNKAQTDFIALTETDIWKKASNDWRANAAAIFEARIQQEQLEEVTKRSQKADLDAASARDKFSTSLITGLEKMQQDTQAQADANDRMGLGKEAIAALDAAKLESQAVILELLAIKTLDKNLDEVQYYLYKAQAEELRNLAKLKGQGAAKEASIDAAKASADEWKKGWEETDRIGREAFTSWTESGVSMADSVGKALKKSMASAIYETTFKPIAFSIYSNMTGAPAGASSLSQAGSAAGIYNAGSSLGFIGAGTSAFGAGASLQAAGMGTEAFSAGMTMMTEATGASSFMAGAGQALGAIGPVGWAALAAIAVLSLQDHGTPTQNTGNASASFDAAGNRTAYQTYFGGSSANTDAMIGNMQLAYLAGAKSLGITAAATNFSYGSNTGKDSQNPMFALSGGSGASSYSLGETTYSDAAVSLAASRAVFAALQGSDLPQYLAKAFNGAVADTMTQDQITNTLNFASSLKQVREGLLETREPLQIFKDNVAAGFATLATSADTFKTDFVAAIDAGVSPATLAAWQALATTMDQLTAATEAANVALATSKSAVLGASEKVSSVLRAIGNDVKAFADAATTAHDNLVGARLNISEALWSAQDRVIELQRQAADGLRTFAASIDDFLNTINPATSSSASLAMLKAQLSTTAVLAAGGDTGAQGQLISQAQAVLKAAEASSTDRVQYARSEAFVRSTLATVKKAVDPAPIVDAVAVAIVDPMATAKAELKAAQDAVIAYSLLAQTTGAATDRSTRLVAGSVADLATAYGVALVANTDAQANYAEALRVTSELQTTVNGTWDSLSKNLTDLDTANAAIITASGALAAELGKPNMPADELAKVLGLAGTAATNFVTRLNAALTNTSAVVPPVTAASVTTSGGTLAGVQTVTMPAAVAALVTAQSSAPGASAGQIVNAAAVNLGVSATDMVRVGTAAGDAAIVAAATAAASKMHGSGGSIAGAKDYSMAELQAVLSGESAKGFTAAQLIGAAVSGYGLTEADVRKVGKSLSLPGYAIGTNYLQKDGPIFAHAGEEITPRPFVDMQRAARDETNDLLRRLLASNAELKAEVTALKRSNEAGTKAAEKTAETLITVTRGGRAVQTEVFI